MILTVVIGNTNTKLVWFEGRRPAKSRAVSTVEGSHGILPNPGRVCGVAIASVVPEATATFCARLRSFTGLRPFIVGAQTRTELRFRYRRRDLGADRVCAALGAWQRFRGQNVIVFDFGTATTVNVILGEGIFAGGAILPGIRMCLDALAGGTAGLPRLPSAGARSPIQHDTRTAIQSGVANLFAGGIDRIIDTIEQDTGRSFRVVATGGGAISARRYTKRISSFDPHLASRGLADIFYLNHATRDVARGGTGR
jgi:type III pantothenate kinase